ncbi:MAG: hypothetical protein WAV23_01215 [Minisyncoccia bacterium]
MKGFGFLFFSIVASCLIGYHSNSFSLGLGIFIILEIFLFVFEAVTHNMVIGNKLISELKKEIEKNRKN